MDSTQRRRQLYLAYNNVGLTIEDFEGEKFKRIAHVTKLIADGMLDDSLRPRSRPKNRGYGVNGSLEARDE